MKKEELHGAALESVIKKGLKTLFPHGDPSFIELALEMMRLHSEKNHDFARDGDPLGNFERVSAIKGIYPDIDWTTPYATAIDYMLKQFDAGMWMLNKGFEGEVENVDTRFRDVQVYTPIIRLLLKRAKNMSKLTPKMVEGILKALEEDK